MPSSSVFEGQDDEDRVEQLGLHDLAVLGGIRDQGGAIVRAVL